MNESTEAATHTRARRRHGRSLRCARRDGGRRSDCCGTAREARIVADNAKKVGGVTAAQLGAASVQLALRESPAGPSPSSTSAGLVTLKTAAASLAANDEGEFTVSCDAGQKVMGGGFTSKRAGFKCESYPASDSVMEARTRLT